MKRKGFTLIELLAVIVILAIIALIATPIIIEIQEDATKESEKRSIELYASAIKNAIASYQLTHPTAPKSIDELDVEYSGDIVCKTIEIFEDGTVSLANCIVNGNEVDYAYGPSFKYDSWQTIAANVKAGYYKVGDTKEVAITGYRNGEANSNGLYTVRIANTSTPEECNQAGFSQSACGFVIEFVDIITEHRMNPTGTNVGGWPASEMYKFLNDTTDSTITSIYESLPEDLQKVIEPTQVVSSHGRSDSSNFTSTDKLYLLSTKEVWGKEGTSNVVSYDTAEAETRQLDYYKNIGVTTSNYSGAIKNYNGSAERWWLRSAASDRTDTFYCVRDNGAWAECFAYPYFTNGVVPAFRIG